MSESITLGTPDPQDNYAHPVPPDADRNWQETWWTAWYDPDRGAGGFHHYGLQHGRGHADVWDWIVVDRRVVAFRQRLDLPMPAGEFPDLEVDLLKVQTKEPTSAFSLTSQHPQASVDLHYEAFHDPVQLLLGGSVIFAGHYESMGTVEGTVHHGDRTIDVSGVAFQDHSWGARDHGAMVTHRWMWAVFGPDLYLTTYAGYNATGQRRVFGYVQDGDQRHVVTAASFGLRVHDDGFTPAGCDLLLTTATGENYHVLGESDVGQPISHHDGFMMTDAVTRFECNGRRGAGLLECRELGSPAPWQTDLHVAGHR